MDRLQTLNLELAEHSKADYDYQTTVATVLSVARRAKDIFDSSETHEKRAFINFLVQNPTVAGKELVFDLKKPFDLVLNFADEQRKTVTISDNRPSWLRVVDDVRTAIQTHHDYFSVPDMKYSRNLFA